MKRLQRAEGTSATAKRHALEAKSQTAGPRGVIQRDGLPVKQRVYPVALLGANYPRRSGDASGAQGHANGEA